jgi:hypothetical protein
MGNGLSKDFDQGRELFDKKQFRPSIACFFKEWARMSADKQLDSEDGVTQCQFLGVALDVVGDYSRAAVVWDRRRHIQEDKLEIHAGRGLNQSLEMLGRALVWTGEGPRAAEVLERAMQSMALAGDKNSLSYSRCLFDLAFARFFFDDGHDRAVQTMRECAALRQTLATANKQDVPEWICSKFFLWSFPEVRDDVLLEECKQNWGTGGKDLVITTIRKVGGVFLVMFPLYVFQNQA